MKKHYRVYVEIMHNEESLREWPRYRKVIAEIGGKETDKGCCLLMDTVMAKEAIFPDLLSATHYVHRLAQHVDLGEVRIHASQEDEEAEE